LFQKGREKNVDHKCLVAQIPNALSLILIALHHLRIKTSWASSLHVLCCCCHATLCAINLAAKRMEVLIVGAKPEGENRSGAQLAPEASEQGLSRTR